MNWLKKFLSFKPKPEEAPKEFVFKTLEGCWVGDAYEYKVQANSAEEALRLLFAYFFGTGELASKASEAVKQTHFTVTKPFYDMHVVTRNNVFSNKDAEAFKMRIGGWKQKEGVSYEKWLRDFATKHNIELKPTI